MDEVQKKTAGSRGKAAEKAVREVLTDLGNRMATFDWDRIYDARSAGGRFPSRPGDFEWYYKGSDCVAFGLIEVKEVAHNVLLPKKNFNPKQVARLRKRQLAGARVIILVHHSVAKVWRWVPLQLFIDNPNVTSWNLGAFSMYPTARSALLNAKHDGAPALSFVLFE